LWDRAWKVFLLHLNVCIFICMHHYLNLVWSGFLFTNSIPYGSIFVECHCFIFFNSWVKAH
jgi:hypothetical protein